MRVDDASFGHAGVERRSVAREAPCQLRRDDLHARRIEGQFPNHQQLIPQTFEHEAVIDRADHPLTVNKLQGDAALLDCSECLPDKFVLALAVAIRFAVEEEDTHFHDNRDGVPAPAINTPPGPTA